MRNTGKRAGTEVASRSTLGCRPPPGTPRRLVAWEKIQLAPGQSKSVTVKLEPKFLSIFNERKDDWELLPGEYKFFVGGSSRDTPPRESLTASEPLQAGTGRRLRAHVDSATQFSTSFRSAGTSFARPSIQLTIH